MKKHKYIRTSGVKELVNSQGKHCTQDFLDMLDYVVKIKVMNAVKTWNGHRKRLTGNMLSVKLIALVLLMAVSGCCAKADTSQDWSRYSDEQICEAIFLAEGGLKAEFAYGIRSVKYKDEAHARQICLESVRNGRQRWIKAGKPCDLISFIGRRYAPVKAPNDPLGLNVYWVPNIKGFLRKGKVER